METHVNGYTLESFPNVFNLVQVAVNSLGADATNIETATELRKWNDYVFDRIVTAKTSFINHFLTTPENGIITTAVNNFGHLHALYESFAIAEPSNMRIIDFQCLHNMNTVHEYVRNSLNALLNVGILRPTEVHDMIQTLHVYVGHCRQFNYNGSNFKNKLARFVMFWRLMKDTLPAWFKFVKKGILYQPNSCAVERLFSLLKRVLTSEKTLALDDYIMTSVYLSYKHQGDYGIIDYRDNDNENLEDDDNLEDNINDFDNN